MKNHVLLFVVSLFLFVGNCWGQITFQRVFRLGGGCEANNVKQTTDGGYITTGYVYINNNSLIGIYLIKTDDDGDTLWTKTFSETQDAIGYTTQQTTDGGYIVAGFVGASDQFRDIYIIKTNADGDTIWTRTYGGINADQAFFIQQTNDSGYVITGETDSFGEGGGDVYLVKINSNGDIAWTKTYGGYTEDFGLCVKQTSDSGYIICGYTYSFGAGNEDVYLIKTKANGDTIWTKTYGGIDDDEGNSVQQTADGGYIITGSTDSFGDSSWYVYLIKTNVNGDTLWTKTYGGTKVEEGTEVQQTNDLGYIIIGITDGFGAGGADVYLIKTNSNGDTLWTKTYGGTNNDYGYSVRQTTDGGYIIAGSTNSFGSSPSNDAVYLIKTDANGNSGCYQGTTNTIVGSSATIIGSTQTVVGSGGTAIPTSTIVGSGGTDSTLCLTLGINELTINNAITLYPNPATDQVVITGNWKENKTLQLTIYNIAGERIYTNALNRKPSTVNCKQFPSGVYFITVGDENEQWVGRFVKE